MTYINHLDVLLSDHKPHTIVWLINQMGIKHEHLWSYVSEIRRRYKDTHKIHLIQKHSRVNGRRKYNNLYQMRPIENDPLEVRWPCMLLKEDWTCCCGQGCYLKKKCGAWIIGAFPCCSICHILAPTWFEKC